jgi:hypothetical protein
MRNGVSMRERQALNRKMARRYKRAGKRERPGSGHGEDRLGRSARSNVNGITRSREEAALWMPLLGEIAGGPICPSRR